jgi:arylsulfatase A-like enzyme
VTRPPRDRLNLLFLWTDEQRPDTIGAYREAGRAAGGPGSPYAGAGPDTPHLDRLAGEGILCRQAYCAMPVCTPSRATVLTGLYPHSHGATHNNIPLPPDAPTVAELLRQEGYACGYAGKWHLGRELQPQRGFEDWWSSMEDGYVLDHAADGYSTYHHWLVGQGYTPRDRGKDGSPVFSRSSAAALPEAAGKPAFLAREACRFLDAYAGQPFALYVNFLEPHMPFTGPRDALYDPQQITLPRTWGGPPDPGMPRRHRLRREYYARENRHLTSDDAPGWRSLVARYWGLANLVDDYAGRILAHLAALGLAERTVVVYSTDHGDMMGEHRLVAKGVQYEGASRVPLLFRIPGLAPRRIETPVSQVDVTPTLLDVLGLPVPPQVQGKSLLPLLRDGDTDPQDGEIVFEWSGARPGEDEAADGLRYSWADAAGRRAVAAQQRTIRRGRWKLTVDEAGDHELYDLQADQDETRNLLYAPDASALQVAQDLWARLRAWQERTADPLTLVPHFQR